MEFFNFVLVVYMCLYLFREREGQVVYSIGNLMRKKGQFRNNVESFFSFLILDLFRGKGGFEEKIIR